MIARLFGRIADKQPNRLIVDVGGVGYDVQVPLSTYYVTSDAGGEMSLRIHTHVREDALLLFGEGTRTSSIVMTLETGAVRFVESIHLEKRPDVKVRFF